MVVTLQRQLFNKTSVQDILCSHLPNISKTLVAVVPVAHVWMPEMASSGFLSICVHYDAYVYKLTSHFWVAQNTESNSQKVLKNKTNILKP